jgi:hypothetical protein
MTVPGSKVPRSRKKRVLRAQQGPAMKQARWALVLRPS